MKKKLRKFVLPKKTFFLPVFRDIYIYLKKDKTSKIDHKKKRYLPRRASVDLQNIFLTCVRR